MPNERMVDIAVKLIRIGVSSSGVQELLSYELDEVERQIAYLPFRHAKRPEAFIIDAVRKRYSAPKDFYIHAQDQAQSPQSEDPMDPNSEPPDRSSHALASGYGAQINPGASPSLGRVESGQRTYPRIPTLPHETDRP